MEWVLSLQETAARVIVRGVMNECGAVAGISSEEWYQVFAELSQYEHYGWATKEAAEMMDEVAHHLMRCEAAEEDIEAWCAEMGVTYEDAETRRYRYEQRHAWHY